MQAYPTGERPVGEAVDVAVCQRVGNLRAVAAVRWLYGAALCAVTLASCWSPYRVPGAQVAERHLVAKLVDPAPAKLEVHVHRGHVLVQPGDQLEVVADIEVSAADREEAERRAASVRISTESFDGTTRVRTTHPEGAPLDAVHARYRVKIPDSVALQVLAREARVALRGPRSPVQVTTESGAVDARAAGGTWEISTVSGPIRLEGAFTQADLKSETGRIDVSLDGSELPEPTLVAESGSGPLQISLPPDRAMRLRFTTVQGDVRSELPVRWTTNGAAAEGAARLYDGLLGEESNAVSIDAQVHTESATLEIRRLPAGT